MPEYLIHSLGVHNQNVYIYSLYSQCNAHCRINLNIVQLCQTSSLPPLVYRRAHNLFTLFRFVYEWWCPTHIVLCFCFVCLRLVYPMLPVSLDCPFLIAPSVFSNVYLNIIYSQMTRYKHCKMSIS